MKGKAGQGVCRNQIGLLKAREDYHRILISPWETVSVLESHAGETKQEMYGDFSSIIIDSPKKDTLF
jgi:hypothetical protein